MWARFSRKRHRFYTHCMPMITSWSKVSKQERNKVKKPRDNARADTEWAVLCTLIQKLTEKIVEIHSIQRRWYSGEHSCLPSSWPGSIPGRRKLFHIVSFLCKEKNKYYFFLFTSVNLLIYFRICEIGFAQHKLWIYFIASSIIVLFLDRWETCVLHLNNKKNEILFISFESNV